jgi:NAD(P)H-flavin reductase
LSPCEDCCKRCWPGGEVGEITLLYGSREPEAILFKEELEGLAEAGRLRLSCSVDFATEIPWAADTFICKVGLVSELLEALRFAPEKTVAAVCGPPSMYGCVLEEIASLGIAPERIHATLERRMKCGVGQCCHCVTAGLCLPAGAGLHPGTIEKDGKCDLTQKL